MEGRTQKYHPWKEETKKRRIDRGNCLEEGKKGGMKRTGGWGDYMAITNPTIKGLVKPQIIL